MFRNLRIGTKLISSFLLVVIISVLTIGYFSYKTAEKNLRTQILQDLTLFADIKEGHLLSFLSYLQDRAVDFSSDGFIRDSVSKIVNNENGQTLSALDTHLIRNKLPLAKSVYGINILDLEGNVIASTYQEEIGRNYSNTDYFREARQLPYGKATITDVFFSSRFGIKESALAVAAPLMDKETGERLGVLVNHIRSKELDDLMTGWKKIELGASSMSAGSIRSFESYLVNENNLRITRSFNYNDILKQEIETRPVIQCQKRVAVSEFYSNHIGTPVVGASACLKNGWVLLVEISQKEAFAGVKSIKDNIIISTLGIIVVVILLVYFLIKGITKPIQNLSQVAKKLAEGDLNVYAEVETGGEIGRLATAFNEMTVRLRALYENLEQKVKERTHELRRSMRQLAREKDKINTILYSIGDGVFVIDKDYRILVFNEIAADISGFSIEEAMGKRYDQVLKFVYERTKQADDNFIKKAMTTGNITKMSKHALLIRKDGKEVPVDDSAAPFRDNQGNIAGCVVVFRDVTKEREIDQMKSEFVSISSHQLRTPLTGIKWFTELLLAGKVGKISKKQREYLSQVFASNERMIKLVDDLLSVSRIETGRKFNIILSKIDIVPTIKIAITEQSVVARKKNITIKLSKSVPKKCELLIDEGKIRQVFYNLISNAVKYSKDKSVVEIGCDNKDKKEITFYVKDKGLGIPKDQQSKIFEKFFRASSTPHIDGTGLGLYIAKSIVELHGGKIWFESVEGKGTTFYFTLQKKSKK